MDRIIRKSLHATLLTGLLPIIGVMFLGLSGCAQAPSYWVVHDRFIDTFPDVTVDLDKDKNPSETIGEGSAHLAVLSGEARPAKCADAGEPWTRELTIPPDAKLRFGYGSPQATESPVTFRIRIEGDGHEDETVFSQTLQPGSPELWTGWHDGEVDLSYAAGRDLRVSFDHQSGGSQKSPAIGCWSSPEVLTRSEHPQPPNVVLISIDTLRADGLSIYGNPRPTSPNIDEWARKRGVVFTRTISQAPWTLPSHTSMFTGLDAVRHGASHNGPAPQSLVTIAEMLHEQGYFTMAVTGGAYLHPQFGLAQGFDVFKYWPDGQHAMDEVDAVTEAAQRLLQRPDDSPFFLLIHTYEVHNRGQPRDEFFREHSSLDPDLRVKVIKDERVAEDGYLRRMRSKLKSDTSQTGWIDIPEDAQSLSRDIYDSRVNYADMRLGPILESLSRKPLGDNTIVILTSDHGEMLGEHGFAGHIYLYEENLLIPLIIASDTLAAPGTSVPHQVRSIDIVPTVLELTGIDHDGELDGRSLVPLADRQQEGEDRQAWSYVATSNRGLSLTMPSFKYIFNDTAWSPVNQTVRFYDLERFPHELETNTCPENLAADLGAQSASMIMTTMSGVRLRITNNLDEPIITVLGGPPITLSRVKSVGAPPGTIIESRKASKAKITIPPGADFTIFLMDTKDKEFTVAMRGRPASTLPSWGGRFVDSEIGAGRMIRFDGQTWQSGEIDQQLPGDVTLVVLPDRSNPSASQAPEEINDELRAQLEALGYL